MKRREREGESGRTDGGEREDQEISVCTTPILITWEQHCVQRWYVWELYVSFTPLYVVIKLSEATRALYSLETCGLW